MTAKNTDKTTDKVGDGKENLRDNDGVHIHEDLASLSRHMELLQEQVDVLQIEVADPRKPWYQRAPIIVSVLALVATVIFNAYGFHRQRIEGTRNELQRKLERVHDAVLELTEIRLAMQKMFSHPASPERNTQDSIYNGRRQILVGLVELLTTDPRVLNELSSETLSVLAGDLMLDSRFTKALKYAKLAKAAARDPLAKQNAAMILAGIHMAPPHTPEQLEAGRKEYREALDCLDSQDDLYMQYLRGKALQQWAWTEIHNNQTEEAKELLKRARQEFEAMDERQVMRSFALDSLDQMEDNPFYSEHQQKMDFSRKVLGEWIIQYPNDPSLAGTALMAVEPTTGGLVVTGELFRDKVLASKWQGRANTLGTGKLHIDWQRTLLLDVPQQYPMIGASTMPQPISVMGSSIVQLDKSKRELAGEEWVIGRGAQPVEFTRPPAS